MSDTYRQQIDAGLIEDPGPCEHGCLFDGAGCLECRVKDLEKENKELREDYDLLLDDNTTEADGIFIDHANRIELECAVICLENPNIDGSHSEAIDIIKNILWPPKKHSALDK